MSASRRKRTYHLPPGIRAKKNACAAPVTILYLGRRDLKKGMARAPRRLFAIGVDPRSYYLADVYPEDLTLLWQAASLLRKAKLRSIATSYRDFPH
jgi:hypothetical protein